MTIGASKQDEEKMELKMTSMIDVVFLLLIFFIVTLQIPEPEVMIETELPAAQDEGEHTAMEDMDIHEFRDLQLRLLWNETAARTEIRLNNEPVPGQRQLEGRLRLAHRLHPDGRIVIACDDDVPYNDLIQTIATIQLTNMPLAFADL